MSAQNSTFITPFQATTTTTCEEHMPLIEDTWRSNKRISTHYNSMRNSEFIKSTNTNSQTRRNSEELQEWESCTVQLAPAAPKEEATATLNWTTFSMQRLTHQKTPAISADFFFCRFTKSNCPVFILSFSWRLTARKWKKIPIIILSTKSAKKHSPH